MTLKLDVDGVRTENPGDTDIARGFESLPRQEARLLSGPGISMIILSHTETEYLMATGTYAQGFTLSYQDGNAIVHNSDIHQPVPTDKLIKIFQSYARGEDWGQSTFKWEDMDLGTATPPGIIKWVILLLVAGFVAVAIFRFLAHR